MHGIAHVDKSSCHATYRNVYMMQARGSSLPWLKAEGHVGEFRLHIMTIIIRMMIIRDRKSRQNQAGIGHSAPSHSGRHACAIQDYAQTSAPGQKRTRSAGGATTHGRRTRQAGESVPAWTPSEAGGCTPQKTHQARTLRRDLNTTT